MYEIDVNGCRQVRFLLTSPIKNKNKMEKSSKLVKVYYNDVYVSGNDEQHEVYKSCAYVTLPSIIAEEVAQYKLASGEWHAYLIPSFFDTKMITFLT